MWNQAQLIKKTLARFGVETEMTSYISVYDIMMKRADMYMWFAVLNPTWVADQCTSYLEAKEATGGRAVFYVTIEGIPYTQLAHYSSVRYTDFVANSHFTANCLKKAGLKVRCVVHHGIDYNLCRKAKERSLDMYRRIHSDFKDRVVFLYVGRDDHRKQLDRLMKAVDILNEKCPDDFVLLCWTELRRPKLFERPNVYVVGQFGSRPYYDVLKLMASVDYTVFPSVCEGFGLPVLESMAVGTPVVHCWFPPLSEFSLKDVNITFDYTYEEFWKTSAEQYFWMHFYDPEELADAMIRAIDIYKNHPDDYKDRCERLAVHARKWDYLNVYKAFAKMLGIEVVATPDGIADVKDRRQLFGRCYFEGGLSNYEGYAYAEEWSLVARELTEVFQLKGKRVLDVGCAYGYLVNELRKLGVQAVGVDISDYAMLNAKKSGITDVIHADALHLPFKDKSFYCTIAFDLVEHIPPEYERQLIKELVRVTQKYILVRTPYWKTPEDADKTHVNIRPASYWIKAFESFGCRHNIDLQLKYHYMAVYNHPKFADDCLVFEVVQSCTG